MKKAVLLGLDKVDADTPLSFFCKGIVLSLLGMTVDVFFDPIAEPLKTAKAELIKRRFPNLVLHNLNGAIDECCQSKLLDADFIIVNPMSYSVEKIAWLTGLGKRIYYDLAGLPAYKKDYLPFADSGFLVFLDCQELVYDRVEVMKAITARHVEYACIFDVSGSISAMDKHKHLEFISLFVEPAAGNFFFLSSVYLSGIIYGLENGYNISEAMRMATALVDLIAKNGDEAIGIISEAKLRQCYDEEFPSLDE